MPIKTGKCILAKDIRLDRNYINILDYSESNMLTLVQSKAVATISDCSFVKPDINEILVSTQYGTALQANYIAFQNPDYSNKWFFGFIDDVKYISDGTTKITFTVDECSTWFDYWQSQPCFILREHTNDDTAGNNLIPEGLEHGEYVTNGEPIKMSQYNHKYFVINADKAPATDGSGNPKNTSTLYSVNTGGLPMSGGLFLFDNMPTLTNAFLTYSRMEGGLDHIKNVYVANEFTIEGNDYEYGDFELDEYAYYKYKGRSNPVENTSTLSRPSSINGYTPRNKKLLTAPYQYILLSNNNGGVNELDYEYFSNPSSITIKAKGIPTVGGSIVAYPMNYKGAAENYNESIMGGKLPTLSWSGDAYTNWLTQNAVNIGTNVTTNALGIGASVATGMATGGLGSVIGLNAGMSGINTIANQLTELYNHSIVPNTFSGNTNGGDVSTAGNMNNIYIWKMSITSQFAQILDYYFDLYGYKTNKIKTPNITGRSYWNYVQIADQECIVYSNKTISVPTKSMEIINNVYRRGVTIWHNHDNIGNYSLNNTIV